MSAASGSCKEQVTLLGILLSLHPYSEELQGNLQAYITAAWKL
jgi:hypothetical protein